MKSVRKMASRKKRRSSKSDGQRAPSSEGNAPGSDAEERLERLRLYRAIFNCITVVGWLLILLVIVWLIIYAPEDAGRLIDILEKLGLGKIIKIVLAICLGIIGLGAGFLRWLKSGSDSDNTEV